ncbi:MAG TPA: substrate-binding domain-containing protein [Candidatus Binatia bacterium]|nr:substrate-binding domain-containing protein [Candidatus Binatia bacterium]
MSALRNRVAERRIARGWSQQELARRSGLSRTAVSAIEIARVAPATTAALALAAAFECRVEDLFSLHHPDGAKAEPQWAWQPHNDASQLWRATIGTRTLLYPAERTAAGLLPPDGVLRAGHVELNHRADPARTLIVAGCDPAIGLLRAEVMRSSGIELLPLIRPSRHALDLLRQDLVHVAGVHLQDRTAPAGNRRAVRELAGSGYTLLRVARWQEGLALAPDLHIRTIKEAVSGKLRWVARQPGSGARHCLDDLFRGRRHAAPRFNHVASDHQAVVETIRSGWAQAGVCVRLCAAEAGLDFLAAREEDYDLCYRSDRQDDPRIQALFNAVRSHSFQAAMAALPGYGAKQTGEQTHV